MSVFVVLPPRECLEQAVCEFVKHVLPGLPSNPAVTDAFMRALEFEANRADDTFFIHREELPGLGGTIADLIDTFGAEPGDYVVDIGSTASNQPNSVRKTIIHSRAVSTISR